MVKLSEQLKEKEAITRPTRTERVKLKQEFEKEKRATAEFQAMRKDAFEKISKADYENYEEVYNSIDPKYREGIMTPTELKGTDDYQKYQEEKRQLEVIGGWGKYFDAYNRRNRPFVLGLNPDQEDVRKFNEVKKALAGKPSTVPDYVLNYYRGQVRPEFGTPQRVYGLDVGETRTITTKDKETGEIKRVEQYKKVIDPETKKPQTLYSIEEPTQPKGSYVDPSGQGVSITEENLLKGIEEGKLQAGGTYRSTSGEYYDLTSTKVKSDFIDERTGKPFGFVDVAPTNKEIYKREISEKGYVKGTVSYFAGKFEGLVLKKQFERARKNPNYELYQPYATGRLARFGVETVPYFTPVGVPLLLAGGGEALITKSGRERIKVEEKYLIDEKNYNKIVAKAVAYGKPALEFGVGLLGLKAGYKNIKATREKKLFEKTPAIVTGTRLEGTKGGIDVIYGLKKVGKTTYVTKIRQPYYLTERGFTLEKGSAFSYRSLKPNLRDLKVSYSEIAGRGQTSQKLSSYTKKTWETPYLDRDLNIVSKELEGYQAGYGRLLTTEKATGLIKIRRGIEFPTGRLRQDVIANINKIKFPKTTKKIFGGIGKEEEGIINVIGGEAKGIKGDYDIVLDKLINKKLKVNIENIGKIKKIKVEDLVPKKQFELGDIPDINKLALKKFQKGSGNVEKEVEQVLKEIVKQKPQQATGYQTQAVEEVLSKLVPKTTTVPKLKPFFETKQPQLQTKIKTQTQIQTSVIKEDQKIRSDLKQEIRFKDDQRIKTRIFVDQKIKQDQKADQRLKSQIKQLQEIKIKDQFKYRTPILQIEKQLQKQQQRTSLRVPLLRTPFTPRVPKIPKIILPPIPLKPKIEQAIIRKKKKSKFDFAYLPDFTARALGLEAETVSEKQAQTRLKKLLTGFEIRRGVVIK